MSTREIGYVIVQSRLETPSVLFWVPWTSPRFHSRVDRSSERSKRKVLRIRLEISVSNFPPLRSWEQSNKTKRQIHWSWHQNRTRREASWWEWASSGTSHRVFLTHVSHVINVLILRKNTQFRSRTGSSNGKMDLISIRSNLINEIYWENYPKLWAKRE